MASIFTYNEDPPRVASPWLSAIDSPSDVPDDDDVSLKTSRSRRSRQSSAETRPLRRSGRDSVTRLSAEPETGPTEYKLHLLLRPRRSASSSASSTPRTVARGRSSPAASTAFRDPTDSPPLAASNSSRQHRLEQLTTQLLWRLQQSSPFSSAAATNLVLPTLPEASAELRPPQQPAKLVAGLEESNGALYEIGVADDGKFVGLTRDEMNESLNNLQAMAACLGCTMNVLRMVPVGPLSSEDIPLKPAKPVEGRPDMHEGCLYVAEAYIQPVLERSVKPKAITQSDARLPPKSPGSAAKVSAKEQLRVTLTGATTSGKSSLLGTLSTSTLDNGRGLSRLNQLKHRHEIASGITSSVAQELIGYRSSAKDVDDAGEAQHPVVNYATEDVSSWNDIHAMTEDGRLVFLSDSAGHPKYRRTTVRGLVGCVPHWTMLCMAASDSGDVPVLSAAQPADADPKPFPGASAHISMAHLDLCLKLRLPLIVLITKLDAASRTNFRQMLSTLLTTLKEAGRKPIMVANDNRVVNDEDLQQIAESDEREIKRVIRVMGSEIDTHVPIVFTSALKGTGIGKVHALLRHLPFDTPSGDHGALTSDRHEEGLPRPPVVFHVDDVFVLDPAKAPRGEDAPEIGESSDGAIISGHLARGRIAVGQTLLLGPFSFSASAVADGHSAAAPLSNSFLTPRSFTDALARVTSPSHTTRILPAAQEWRRVRVVSIRNLRLPVQILDQDRMGTVGIVAADSGGMMQIRRGMVVLKEQDEEEGPPAATQTMTALFDAGDASSITVGSRVVLYSTTIRSSAKVLAVALSDAGFDDSRPSSQRRSSEFNDDFAFGRMEGDDGPASDDESDGESNGVDSVSVTLRLDSVREYVEVGSRVLLMPGGGPGLHAGERGTRGLAGLEAFVGRVIETFE